MAGYVKKYWPHVLVSGGSILTISATEGASPYVTKMVIDVATSSGPLDWIVLLVAVLIGLALLRGIARFITMYVDNYVSNKVAFDIRADLFRCLQFQSFAFYDKARTGQLISRLTSDVNEISRFLGWMVPFFFINLTTFLFSIFMMFSLSAGLSSIALLSVPAIVLVAVKFSSAIGPIHLDIRKVVGQLTSVVQENLIGVKTVRSLASEPKEMWKFDAVANGLFDLSIMADRLRGLFLPLTSLILGVSVAAFLWFGGQEVISGAITIGTLVALVTYLSMVAGPIRMLGFMLEQSRRAVAGATRIFEIMDTQAAVTERPNSIELKSSRGEVAFEDVSFSYAGQPAVDGLNLIVKPGEKIAIVGRTGSGKTTVLNLIPRFYDVTSGRVTIDGTDIRDLKIASLRRLIGVVPQEPFIFPTTMRDNITLGDESHSDEQVVEASKAAMIYDFISSLPKEFDTPVGEMGVTLSGGQRQRISIARAIVKDPRIVLLDDSTSSVDVATEKEIEVALKTLLKGRTTFIITHRLATASRADRVVVMDKGKVAAVGRHEDLLRNSQLYRELFSDQMGELAFGEVSE